MSEKTILDLIQNDSFPLPKVGLRSIILERIQKLERRRIAIHLCFLSFLSAASLMGVVVSFFSLGKALKSSGFFNYLSLVTSDSTVIMSYWKEISFSLVESLPSLSIALLLCVLGVFIWSSSKTVTRAREIFRTA